MKKLEDMTMSELVKLYMKLAKAGRWDQQREVEMEMERRGA